MESGLIGKAELKRAMARMKRRCMRARGEPGTPPIYLVMEQQGFDVDQVNAYLKELLERNWPKALAQAKGDANVAAVAWGLSMLCLGNFIRDD